MLASYKDMVERHLAELIPAESVGQLARAMRYGVLGGGKRLRPALVLASSELLGGASADALDPACAVEMVHAYSLIHDDLPAIDDGVVRHGQPTCHRAFGEAVAVLAGDALLTLAFETIVGADLGAEVKASLVQELAGAAGPSGMVLGQASDLAFSGRADLDESDIEFVHARKTAALVRASVRMGAVCARASAEQIDCLGRYGHSLGMAFQIADDILDAEHSQDALGKDTGKDAVLVRPSYAGRFGLEAARARLEQWTASAVGELDGFGRRARDLVELAEELATRSA